MLGRDRTVNRCPLNLITCQQNEFAPNCCIGRRCCRQGLQPRIRSGEAIAATCYCLLNLLDLGQFTTGRAELDDIGLAAARGVEGENLAGTGGRLHAGETIA